MMARQFGSFLAIVLAAGAAAGGEARVAPAANGLTNAMRSVYAAMYFENVPTQTLEALQRQAREAVAGADLDGGGLSRQDIALAREIAESSTRADRVRSYFGGDLNQDGVLTLDEYRALLHKSDVERYYAGYEAARERNQPPPALAGPDASLIRFFNDIDTDHDGRISPQDVFLYNPPFVYAPAERYVDAEKYLVLDMNGDGIVTMAEVDATSAAFLAEQTIAGVGPRPARADEEEDEGRSTLRDAVHCPVPAPTRAALIVRLGVRESAQLSDVALGGQDVPTYAVSVDIEPGDAPLYIVATSYGPTIWRFTGATGRVEAFVGSSFTRDARSMWPAVGVTGLPRARFHSAPNACFGEFDERGPAPPPPTSQASQLVLRRLGRPIDVAFGAFQPQGVRLPSGQTFMLPAQVPEIFRTLRNEDAAREWSDFLVHFRGGIARLDPAWIVSRAVPERYEVYSYRAGLAQLLETGAIARSSNQSVNFDIHRQFRFPAGLAGGFSATFQLPDGVPPPIGYAAHSRMMSQSHPRICLIGCR
jgi:hypothetical protein